MLEKTANSEYCVYRQDGKLLMRHPGGLITPYDNRFDDCPSLSEGNQFIKVKENTDE